MTYILAQDAEDDLVDIFDYSSSEWGEDQADIYISEIYDCFELLSLKPLIGRLRLELGPGVRSALVRSPTVYYMRWHDGIAIIRVLHQAREISDDVSESTQRFTGRN